MPCFIASNDKMWFILTVSYNVVYCQQLIILKTFGVLYWRLLTINSKQTQGKLLYTLDTGFHIWSLIETEHFNFLWQTTRIFFNFWSRRHGFNFVTDDNNIYYRLVFYNTWTRLLRGSKLWQVVSEILLYLLYRLSQVYA